MPASHEKWEELFNEEYGPQIVMSAALFEKMLADIKAFAWGQFIRGYAFGFATATILALAIFLAR